MKATAYDYDVEAWGILSRKIMRRDKWRCRAACDCTNPLSVHHIIPRAENGTDDPANLITLCQQCHDEIEATDIRTIERIRAYVPRWHEGVTWYPTKPKPEPGYGTAKKKPKPRNTVKVKPAPIPSKQSIWAECPHCHKWFEPRTGEDKFCSGLCSKMYHRQRTAELRKAREVTLEMMVLSRGEVYRCGLIEGVSEAQTA